MTPPLAPADLPGDADLTAALGRLLPASGATVTARRPNAYTSSSRSEIVTVRTDAGDHLELLVKYDRGQADPFPSCRHGIDYCARVYQAVVAAAPLQHLRALGTIRIGSNSLPALVLEHLDGAFRVGEAPEVSGILSAAEWCGAFHRWAESRRDSVELAFLARYDADYYRAWADRSIRLATAAGVQPPWLERLCRRYRDMADTLATAPTTIIHGEMSPQNVLWRDGEIYPIDWESAAVGPGELDLAALLFGWPEEMVGRCLDAYWEARQTPRPEAFPARWTAATLYTALRWLPPPHGRDDPRFTLALDRLRDIAHALGITAA
jgi:hypothetical protein